MAAIKVIEKPSFPSLIVNDEILATKLEPSYIAGTLLKRGRLLAQIAANPKAKLILIHGAAGSGKSSLLYDYTKNQNAPIAWYSIHESDRDLKVFISYITASITKYHPNLTQIVLPLLQNMANPEQEWKKILTLLINEMVQYQKDIIIALDDYHLLKDQSPIPEVMEFLLLNAPSNFKCFIASRTLPKLPLSYLMSKNALVMLRPRDLLLDSKEIKQLFRNIWNQPISDTAIQLIHTKTEGWFAAIRLIAQAIREKTFQEIELYLNSINLKEHLVYDYLAKEIYRQQPERIREFLKNTSILTSFNYELVEFVTQSPNAKDIIQELERMELFVIHLDGKGEWFRYHHLFSDFLLSLLAKENGKEHQFTLHKRAAQWLEEHEDYAGAVEHYIKGNDFNKAAKLLIQEGQLLFQRGLLSSLLQWMEAIPKQIRGSSPELLLLEGEIHDTMGSWEKAVQAYEKASHILKQNNFHDKVPFVLEKLILCLLKYGEYSKITNYCNQAIVLCDSQAIGIKARLMCWLGITYIAAGSDQWMHGYALIKEGYQLAQRSGDPETIATAGISYGFAYHFPQGNFLEAQRVFNEGAELLTRLGLPFLVCNQIMNKAVVQIFAGTFTEAEETIKEAIQLAETYNIHFVKQALNLTQAILYLEQKDVEKTNYFLRLISQQEIPLQLKPWYYRTVALLHLLEGNIEQAVVAGEEMLSHLQLVGKGMYAPECYLTMGRILWEKHLHYKAIKFFKEALAIAERGKMKFWIMKAHYCLAAIFAILGNRSFEFKEHYQLAVKLCKENDYWHVWQIDLFDFTISTILEGFRLEVELEDTIKIINMVKHKLLANIESTLANGTDTQRTLMCKALGVIDDPKTKTLLIKAKKDPVGKVRQKARIMLSAYSPRVPVLSITTLGKFDITRDKVSIFPNEWKRRKALKIFKYLLAAYPEEVVGDQLIEKFWPKLKYKEAKHNLAVYLNCIRAVLNPTGPRKDQTFIQCTPDLLSLNLKEQDHIDFIDFQLYYKQGIALWNQQKYAEAIPHFKDALKLYKGDFLKDDFYEEWTFKRREKLQQQYLTILGQMGSFYERNNEHQKALFMYQLYMERDPLNKTILQSTLRCFTVMGNKVSAQKLYSKFKQLTKKQLHKSSIH